MKIQNGGKGMGKLYKNRAEIYKYKAGLMGIQVMDKYINVTTPIKHRCPICGDTDWKPIPANIIEIFPNESIQSYEIQQ